MYKFEIMFKSVMQHYPLEPVGNHYPTATFPTADAILRVIANAMGLKLESEEEYASFKEKFTFDVKSEKADHPVTVYTDFEEDPETDEVRYVDYIVDAAFKITVYGEKEDLLKANDALKHPYYFVNLGGQTPSRFIVKEIEEVEE